MNSNAELNIIAELDLAPIKTKLMHKESGEGWSLAQATGVELEYRRFLCLMKLFPHEQTAPRFDVDIFWHYHILDTMKYAVDCERIFGYFLHHFPYAGLLDESNATERSLAGTRMQQLYELTFGEAYIRHGAPESEKAHEPHALTISAWCNPAAERRVWSPTPSANTAWCNPAIESRTLSAAASTDTAWCNPVSENALSPKQALAKISAWCNPATGTTLASPESASTAWCNPVAGNSPWLQGATAISGRRQAVSPNNSHYSDAAYAKAA
ncbi:MAG: hypothetical protein QFF03_03410 [Pseudomonadota bacterium]|nr:hypothetical protein [Pseudomonadota bacterium]